MANVFDQYNQAQQYNISPDQAIGMLKGGGGGGGYQNPNYNPGAGMSSQQAESMVNGLGSSLSGTGGDSLQSDQMSVSPDAGTQWPSYNTGSGSSGGGASSLASIASAFI